MFSPLRSTHVPKPRPSIAQDRRVHQRVKISVMGRYMLPNRHEFPCQTIDMSPGGLALAAPAKGNIGDKVIVYLDTLGRVEGKIVRHLEDGFALSLNTSLAKRDKLGDQLTWIANRQTLGLPEDRRHERITPRNASTLMKLMDGREFRVRVIDISLSGVALKSDYQPPLLTKVTVGDTPGRVIRHFEGGVAIEFSRLLPAEDFNNDIKL
jgi:hypothetical protein